MTANRILYVQFTNPAGYPPLEHSSRLLANAGWQVLFLGTGALGAAGFTFPPHPNIRVRQLAFRPAGWRQKLLYARFLCWVLAWSVCWRPRWIYASDLWSCPIGLLLSYLPGVRVLYHEHDEPRAATSSRFVRWCLATRRRLARRAVLCVAPNADRAARLAEQVDVPRVVCVWNCPTAEEVGPPRRPVASDVWLLYHGSITPPQLPLTVLDALAALPSRVRLRVLGYETVGHRHYVRQLKAKARQLGMIDRVEFLGSTATRGELLAWCGRSDIGLALFARQGLQPMAGASNKPFDYLAHGLALLVSDLPDWHRLYVEPGYALACDPADPEDIARALQWFVDHPEQMRAMGEAGRRRILEAWNYETQFRPVWELLHGGAEVAPARSRAWKPA